jgi:IclR family transcriptional regulator, acetate operon repressor
MPAKRNKSPAATNRAVARAPIAGTRKKIAKRGTAISQKRPKPARRQRDIIARVLAALEYIADAKEPVTAADLSTALGIPRATAYRLFARLGQEQVVIPELGGRGFGAGKRLSDLAVAVLASSTRHGARHRILQRLVDEVGETCNLTALSGSEVVYIDRVETHWPLRMHLSPGSRVPIHCTATGKLLLSLLPKREMDAVIKAAPLRRYAERTITDPEKLAAELARIRAEGVGVDNEEFVTGMVAVSVPVLDTHGHAVAALAVHAPIVRLSLKAAYQHVPTLRRAAAALSELLD